MEGDRVIAVGSPGKIGEVPGISAEKYSGEVLLPGLVNAHVHLDLTAMGPVACDEGFMPWLDEIRTRRASSDEAIAHSVSMGIDLSLAGGTVAVGDIGGAYSWVPFETLNGSSLRGISWVEVFGIGMREEFGLEAIASIRERALRETGSRMRVGISPHAPHSCSKLVFEAAAHSGLPVCSHLAETVEEIEFCMYRQGPLKDLLIQVGVFDEDMPVLGQHPLDAFGHLLEKGAWTIAHVNYPSLASEEPFQRARRIASLANAELSVAFCPRASAFFGHPVCGEAGHPWREMQAAGVRVALGTDGMPCLDTPERISVLDEMRLLARRDAASQQELLSMATVNGAHAVGLDPSMVTFSEGPIAGIIRVPGEGSDPFADALRRNDSPKWVLHPGEGVISP